FAADRLRRQTRRLHARFGFVERGHRGFGARRRPEPQLALEAVDEFEEQRRPEFQRLFLALARRLAGTRQMQALEMPELGADEAHGLRAFAEGAVERALELHGIALGGGEDRFIRGQLGAVADGVERGAFIDRAAIADIERELFELLPADAAVAAEMRDEILHRFRPRGDLMRGENLARQFAELAWPVEVAGQRGGVLRALESAAQRRARRQVAGGDDDERIARRRILEEAIEDRADAVARILHP